MTAWGIGGHPFIDLERYLDLRVLPAIDDEVAFGLTQVPLDYTGGSHKTMGIMPPSFADELWIDYGHAIARMTDAEFRTFVSLSDTPGEFDVAHRKEYRFGEERDHPLSKKQALYLKFKHGVYFPWQVFYEMIPCRDWEDKANGAGKDFTSEAQRHFPELVRFVRALPFREIGRCNILGLEAHHFGTVHQDGDPESDDADHFITICPRRNKRLFLWDEDRRKKTPVVGRAYWFNDHGYHGVEADPFFRYSIRIDGVFEDSFLERVRADWRF